MNLMMKRAALAALLVAAAPSVRAATLVVPDEFPAIQVAIDSAVSGDTVLVRAGAYTDEYITVKDGVNLVGEGAGVTFLTGTTPITLGNDHLFQGFTVTGRGLVAQSKSPVIQWNVIRNAPFGVMGIGISGYSWAIVQHNVIYNCFGGIQAGGGFVTILNNTIVDNVQGAGIDLPSGTYPTANNIAFRNYNGLVTYFVTDVGGYNDAWGSVYHNFWNWAPGDFSANPMLAKVPREALEGNVVDAGAGADTIEMQWNQTSRVLVGDYVELGYDKVVRTVMEVSYDSAASVTRARFLPAAPAAIWRAPLLVWGDTTDFTYDFSLLPGSPCVDGGNPDPIYADADGSRNDVGVTGGTDFPGFHESVPPPQPALTVTGGDSEVQLSWGASTAADTAGYVIIRREGGPVDVAFDMPALVLFLAYGAPANYWIGSSTIVGFLQDPAATGFVDPNRAPGVEYHYAVYAFDAFKNLSTGATGSGTPWHTAKTWVVDAAGSGDFTTIGAGIAAAKAGDTVLVRNGTYREPIVLKEGLALVGESQAGTILAIVPETWSLVTAPPVYHCSIENLTLLNDIAPEAWAAAMYVENASAIDLKDVTVKGFAAGAFFRGFYGGIVGPRAPRIEGCRFEGNGTALWIENWMSPVVTKNTFVGNGGSGFYMENYCNPQITENTFEGNGTGVYVWESSRPLIKNNVIKGNGTGIGHAWSSHSTVVGNQITGSVYDGIYAVSYSSPLMVNNLIANSGHEGLWLFLNWPRAYNNTIVGNGGNGVQIQYYGSVELRNNVIAFNGGWGTWAGETYYPGWPRLYYNDVYANALGDTSPNSQVYEGNLQADPLFRDAAAGDYRLANGSPCIDAGDPSSAFLDPDGSRNDIGAWGGPTALPGGQPTIDERFGDVTSTILVLPDSAFRNEAAGRKETLEAKLQEVLSLIHAGDAATDAAEKLADYKSALSKLQNDLLAKADGSYGGNAKNDWIVSAEAQGLIHPLLTDLINSVQMRIKTTTT